MNKQLILEFMKAILQGAAAGNRGNITATDVKRAVSGAKLAAAAFEEEIKNE